MTDIWTVIETKSKEEAGQDTGRESYALVLGSKQGGKSTLLQQFTRPGNDDTPKPTVALDYSYARRGGNPAPSGSGLMDICHFWELGGNSTAFVDLISIPITPQRLPYNIVVLVLDMSKPSDALMTAVRWLTAIKARVTESLEKLKARKDASSATSVDFLLQQAQARLRLGWAQRTGQVIAFSSQTAAAEASQPSQQAAPVLSTQAGVAQVLSGLPEHPDARLISQFAMPLQLVIVANKYDVIRDDDAPKRKALYAALRYLGLATGAHVLMTSSKDKSTIASFRTVLGHCALGVEGRRGAVTDINKPLLVPAGSDSLESIGLPPAVHPTTGSAPSAVRAGGGMGVTRTEVEVGSLEARFDKYATVVRSLYPVAPKGQGDADDEVDMSNAPTAALNVAPGSAVVFADEASRYPEPMIDAMRAEKAEELARYVREQERKLRLEAKANAQAR